MLFEPGLTPGRARLEVPLDAVAVCGRQFENPFIFKPPVII
ncbi:hypothetical protein GGQ64_000286 [Rhizobium azooxidifex]|uniref:Uncharacterized protein n=1 Tax=Mycoplana azooxidifex TaxID=1636188 RepID=A0A7W6GH84_9HYPH|nr:hypothetical protein [Mycoplana azooxidifex]